jgi:hypothetical protein
MQTIQLNDAKCTGLSFVAPVQLAKGVQDHEFLIEAYTGEVIDRWWGMLSIDIKGIKAKNQIPVLMNHNPDKIVGYSTRTFIDNSFFVSGKFSGVTDSAKEAKGLAGEGFPWQASIGVKPIKIMALEKNGKAEVNGKMLEGPAEIWLESEVIETSFVPLGADGNTSVSTFSKFQEVANNNLGEVKSMEITMEILAKDAPDLLAQIKTGAKKEGIEIGAKEELQRIKEVLKNSMPGHEALVETLAFDGKTSGPEAAVQILAAEKKIRASALENLTNDGVKPVKPVVPPAVETLTNDNITEESFNKSEKLKKEFGTWDIYESYANAVKSGQVKIITKKE